MDGILSVASDSEAAWATGGGATSALVDRLRMEGAKVSPRLTQAGREIFFGEGETFRARSRILCGRGMSDGDGKPRP
jgi:hypothetical protein